MSRKKHPIIGSCETCGRSFRRAVSYKQHTDRCNNLPWSTIVDEFKGGAFLTDLVEKYGDTPLTYRTALEMYLGIDAYKVIVDKYRGTNAPPCKRCGASSDNQKHRKRCRMVDDWNLVREKMNAYIERGAKINVSEICGELGIMGAYHTVVKFIHRETKHTSYNARSARVDERKRCTRIVDGVDMGCGLLVFDTLAEAKAYRGTSRKESNKANLRKPHVHVSHGGQCLWCHTEGSERKAWYAMRKAVSLMGANDFGDYIECGDKLDFNVSV